jgi:hypothetical protein
MVSLAFSLKTSINSKFENEKNLVDFNTKNQTKLTVCIHKKKPKKYFL